MLLNFLTNQHLPVVYKCTKPQHPFPYSLNKEETRVFLWRFSALQSSSSEDSLNFRKGSTEDSNYPQKLKKLNLKNNLK